MESAMIRPGFWILGLWLAAGATVLLAALVSILAIRARRRKKGSEEGAKI